jgi:hypothetical protein
VSKPSSRGPNDLSEPLEINAAPSGAVASPGVPVHFSLTSQRDSTPTAEGSPPAQQSSVENIQAVPGGGISRRDFGLRAVFAAASSLSASAILAGGCESNSRRASESGSPEAQEVEAKLANIIRKYGSRLSDAQREHLRKILTYNQKMLASIWAFPLHNADAPASVLRISALEEKES